MKMKKMKMILCFLLAAVLVSQSACAALKEAIAGTGSESAEESVSEETPETETSAEESESTAGGPVWRIESAPAMEAGTAAADRAEGEESAEHLFDSSDLGVDSNAYCVLDEDGQVVLGRKEFATYAPASITKVMTGLLAAELCNPEEKVTIKEEWLTENMEPMSSGVYPSFKPQETVTVRDLLHALMLSSTNAAGNILAQHMDTTYEDFVNRMNAKAAELGMTHTHFMNAHGLDTPDHYSCAYDMAVLLKAAMQNRRLADVMSSRSYTIPATEYTEERTCYMGHAMVSGTRSVPGVYAGKPGWTVNAQGTLLTAVERNGKKLYVCTMHSDNNLQYDDTANLIEYAYAKLEGRTPRLTPLVHNMVVQKADETGVDLFFVVDNGGKSVRVVYWDINVGDTGAVISQPAPVKPYMGVHLSLPAGGAYVLQLLVEKDDGTECGISFNLLYTGAMNGPGVVDWNGQQYIVDRFGLLRCGGGVEVPEGIFYTNADGSIAHGFCGRFYAGEDGRLVTGWVSADGVLAYCQGDGRLAVGRCIVEGVEHEFDEYGALIR